MKKKVKQKIQKCIKSENGMVSLIEAAYVFPVMFFVIFFLIYFGNMFYVKAAVDSITSCEAIKGAQYYANPWVENVHESLSDKEIPTENSSVQPYRQFTSDKTIQNKIQEETQKKIKAMGGGVFAGMHAKNISCKASYKNYFLYAIFSVEVSYKISFPIRFLGEDERISIDFGSYDTATVTDNTEFIRNTDMVVDYVQRSKIYNEVKDKLQQIKEEINSFNDKFH